MPEAEPYDDYEDYDDEEDDLLLGPDERDRDLLDGSWEQEYYARSQRPPRDWNAIAIGIALLLVMGMVLPTILFALR